MTKCRDCDSKTNNNTERCGQCKKLFNELIKPDSLCCPGCEASVKDCQCTSDTETKWDREPTYEKTLALFNDFYSNSGFVGRLNVPLIAENLPKSFSAHAFWFQQDKILLLEKEIELLKQELSNAK